MAARIVVSLSPSDGLPGELLFSSIEPKWGNTPLHAWPADQQLAVYVLRGDVVAARRALNAGACLTVDVLFAFWWCMREAVGSLLRDLREDLESMHLEVHRIHAGPVHRESAVRPDTDHRGDGDVTAGGRADATVRLSVLQSSVAVPPGAQRRVGAARRAGSATSCGALPAGYTAHGGGGGGGGERSEKKNRQTSAGSGEAPGLLRVCC